MQEAQRRGLMPGQMITTRERHRNETERSKLFAP
jgi:hypothetical protein